MPRYREPLPSEEAIVDMACDLLATGVAGPGNALSIAEGRLQVEFPWPILHAEDNHPLIAHAKPPRVNLTPEQRIETLRWALNHLP